MSNSFCVRDRDGDIVKIIYQDNENFLIKFQEDGLENELKNAPDEVKNILGYYVNDGIECVPHDYYDDDELEAMRCMIDDHCEASQYGDEVRDMEEWFDIQEEQFPG